MGSSWTWAEHSRDLSLLHLTLQVCSDWSWQQSTGQAHTLSLSLLVWSPLVTTAGLMGDGLLMDLGRPGIWDLSLGSCNRVLGTHQLTAHWSWQQSTGQAHTLSLSLLVTTGHHWSPLWSNGPGQSTGTSAGKCGVLATEYWSAHTLSLSLLVIWTTLANGGWALDLGTPGIGHSRGPGIWHSMDLGWSVELGTPWRAGLWNLAWAGLWNWALHGPGLVCGIGHSMDLGWSVELRTLGWSVELGTLWTWAVFTLATLELGAPWAWGLWSLWIWDTPRTWGLPVPPNSLSLCCTECLFPPLWHSGRESINTSGGPDDEKWTYTPLFPRDGLPCIPGSSSRSLGSEIIL